jgi:hypothetical protein
MWKSCPEMVIKNAWMDRCIDKYSINQFVSTISSDTFVTFSSISQLAKEFIADKYEAIVR